VRRASDDQQVQVGSPGVQLHFGFCTVLVAVPAGARPTPSLSGFVFLASSPFVAGGAEADAWGVDAAVAVAIAPGGGGAASVAAGCAGGGGGAGATDLVASPLWAQPTTTSAMARSEEGARKVLTPPA